MMRLVNQKAEILERSESKINNIANIARICYKSENKADDESNSKLVENLIKSKHFAMLEHEDYILYFADDDKYILYCDYVFDIEKHFGIKLHLIIAGDNTISGNIRAWRNFYKYILLLKKRKVVSIEYFPVPKDFQFELFFNDILLNSTFFAFNIDGGIKIIDRNDLSIKNDVMAHYRISAKIICDRGISHELVRHRVFSFAQESTRYVNYNNKEMQFIDYSDFKDKFNDEHSYNYFILYNHHNSRYTTNTYKDMIKHNIQPQFARNELPHNLKTELVMTGNLYAWLHFFNLRLFERTGKAHPMIKELAEQLYNDFENKTPISKKLIDSWAEEMWENEQE